MKEKLGNAVQFLKSGLQLMVTLAAASLLAFGGFKGFFDVILLRQFNPQFTVGVVSERGHWSVAESTRLWEEVGGLRYYRSQIDDGTALSCVRVNVVDTGDSQITLRPDWLPTTGEGCTPQVVITLALGEKADELDEFTLAFEYAAVSRLWQEGKADGHSDRTFLVSDLAVGEYGDFSPELLKAREAAKKMGWGVFSAYTPVSQALKVAWVVRVLVATVALAADWKFNGFGYTTYLLGKLWGLIVWSITSAWWLIRLAVSLLKRLVIRLARTFLWLLGAVLIGDILIAWWIYAVGFPFWASSTVAWAFVSWWVVPFAIPTMWFFPWLVLGLLLWLKLTSRWHDMVQKAEGRELRGRV